MHRDARIPRHIVFIPSFGYAYHLPAHSSVRSFRNPLARYKYTRFFFISRFLRTCNLDGRGFNGILCLSCTCIATYVSFFRVFFTMLGQDAATVVDR